MFCSEDGAEGKRWCPEEEASWVSWLYLGFISTLVDKGYRKPLRQEDLWSLPRTEETDVQCRLFDAALEATKDPVSAPQVCLAAAFQGDCRCVVILQWAEYMNASVLAHAVEEAFLHGELSIVKAQINTVAEMDIVYRCRRRSCSWRQCFHVVAWLAAFDAVQA